MPEYLPLLFTGALLGMFSVIFLVAFFSIKDRQKAMGFDRHMKDSEIVRRLLRYARPHTRSFVLVLFIMLFSITYDIVAPLIISNIE